MLQDTYSTLNLFKCFSNTIKQDATKAHQTQNSLYSRAHTQNKKHIDCAPGCYIGGGGGRCGCVVPDYSVGNMFILYHLTFLNTKVPFKKDSLKSSLRFSSKKLLAPVNNFMYSRKVIHRVEVTSVTFLRGA
jgi:hypothetical protein